MKSKRANVLLLRLGIMARKAGKENLPLMQRVLAIWLISGLEVNF